MKSGWAPLAALVLAGCGQPMAAEGSSRTSERWCEEFYARFNVSDLVSQKTGRVERDPTTNEILDPETGEIALTRREEECVRRQAEKAIDAYEGNAS